MSNRIADLMKNRNRRKLLVPFFTAGFPDSKIFVGLVKAAETAGADMIEIGLPFSDPLADGTEIQYSSQIALENKISMTAIWEITRQIRSKTDIPLIYMGYYNPIIAYSEERFLKSCKNAGCDGLIVPDLTPEESGPYKRIADILGLSTIFLVAPTSTDRRIQMIDTLSSDFVYTVTVTGVTGLGKSFDTSTETYLRHIRKQLTKPFVAGFGVSSVASAKRLAENSDGVVIGSKLVRIIRESKNKKEAIREVERFLISVRKAI